MARAILEDLLNSFNDSLNTYDLWYKTKVRKLSKHQVFKNIEEAEKWIRKNKNNIIPTSGSWQLLELFR